MATGSFEFMATTIMQHTHVGFILPTDVDDWMKAGNPHYDRPAKTMILLHGYTGSHTDWLYGGNAQELAWEYNLNIFIPTAGNSFYLNRNYPEGRYADYIGIELPQAIHRMFGLSVEKEDMIVAGFSMGGFGALHTGLAYPEQFGAVVALSSAGIVEDLQGLKEGEDRGLLSSYGYYREVFGDLDKLAGSDANPEVLYEKLAKQGAEIPAIYMAIGTEDFLYRNNQSLRAFFEKGSSKYLYEEGPGVHNWVFWNEYIKRGTKWALNEMY